MPESFEAIPSLIALLSALYARWTWTEAKNANRISLHQYRKDIYDAFLQLRMHMTQYADQAVLSEVTKFYYPSINAKFYFNSELAREIECYYDLCFKLADKNRNHLIRDELITQAYEAQQCATVLNEKLTKNISVHK
ncbi:hypothetical protein ACET7V_10725 [Aeromonas sanarellii]|uniref:hypothetical protein n=1 Tax=Aeromonas sanarellii TaxID=633415 RepID=UPI0038D05375